MAASTHPHFNDRGTLAWHSTFDGALAEAKRDGKLVFIEMGRVQCGNCRSLVESVVPQAGVAKLLAQSFVAVASDIDDPEPAVLDLAMQNMPDAMMLPFVLFTDAEGNFLAGGQGAVNPSTFAKTLEGLAARA
ncbi:MAG TPA: thioredoxin family protein [Planctomycetota bacterium]|nr:thioredoxin family protein [Planctomycetota bacterium]